jgi:predicted ATPase/transcriptional regulator with XRE-family HTH domain
MASISNVEQHVSFGEWLRRRRAEFGLTQAELARELGCAPITLRKVEAEERRPSPELAQRMVEILRVPAEQRDAFMRFARGEVRAGEKLRAAPQPIAIPVAAAATVAVPRLPIPPYDLIGREDLLARAKGMLAGGRVRVLSLVGPPGVGKTRLALELAQDAGVNRHFTHGTAFIELAPAQDAALVPAVIAESLRIEDSSAADTASAVRAALGRRNMLLVLDNFEHVLDAAPFVAELIEACKGVACLITSRERLRVRAEHVLNVPPLDLPQTAALEHVQAAAASRLFVACAQRANSQFILTAADAPAIAALCARLDGLPLALELLAARADVHTPQQLHDDLVRGLDALQDGPRDMPERQRTLRSAIHSSVCLLTEAQQTQFAHLAVFAGSFDAEAARAVCSCADETLPALVRCSLVQPFGEGRWRLLEPIRQYAEEMLAKRNELDDAKARHAGHMAAVAEVAREELLKADAVAWMQRLEFDNANLQAAVLWSLGAQQPEFALRIGQGVFRFWHRRGMWRESLDWFEQALALDEVSVRPAPLDIRAKAARAAGVMAHALSQFERAARHLLASLALAQQLEDDAQVAAAYTMLGILLKDQGRFDEALAHFDQSIRYGSQESLKFPWQSKADTLLRLGRFDEGEILYQQAMALNKRIHDDEGLAHTLRGLGVIAWQRGDADAAEAYFRENEIIAKRLNHQHALSWTRQHYGNVARLRGQWREASEQYAYALERMSSLGDQWAVCDALAECAHLAVATGHYDLAARWLSMARAGFDALGAKLTPYEEGVLEATLSACAQHLDAQAIQHAASEGQRDWYAGDVTRVIDVLQATF